MEDDDDVDSALTTEEAKAIASLQRLARRWPQSLQLVSLGGGLNVFHFGEDKINGAFDPDKVLASIEGIPNDGGDW